MLRLAAPVALLAFVAACGSVSPASNSDGSAIDAPLDAPPTAASACAQVAAALCDRLDACSPTALKVFYGDKATCTTRANLSCTTDQGTSGIKRTPDDLVACATALGPARCADLLANQYPAACDDMPGLVVNGAACGSNLQCVSTYCNKMDAACGVCSPRQQAGGDCTVDDGCVKGLVCANKKCVTPGDVGADCNPPNQPCRADLYCGKVMAKCLAKVGVGAACPDDQACDLTRGAVCIKGVCEMIDVAKAGDACGLPTKTVCTGFQGLGAGDPCSNLLTGGICARTAEDGTACGMDHKVCLAPATCVEGVCRLPSAPNCH
ncbi:MAG TPA: hypothetical protein VHJ20_05660 [Polyangia bacterium]|nr:hypothetical protein [Polyangia bacterium]